ncbi:TPA: hypothetical protein ROY42_005640 [Bacillus thuringiensis]|nr:hypothetical protein [Bacillus thuringiensis]
MAELIKQETGAYYVGVKRLYAPYFLKVKCPNPDCLQEMMVDFEQIPVATEPMAGEPFGNYIYCENCTKDFVVNMRIDVTLSLVDENDMGENK